MHHTTTTKARRAGIAVGAAALVAAGATFSPLSPARATHQPADKIGVAAGSIDKLQSGVPFTLLTGMIKTSSPTDLIIQATAECDIVTEVQTTGNEVSESTARIKLYVELDGATVPVSADDAREPGKVVFCDRTHRQSVTGFVTEDPTINQFLQTRTANAFNWITLNVGSSPSPHRIELKGVFEGSADQGLQPDQGRGRQAHTRRAAGEAGQRHQHLSWVST